MVWAFFDVEDHVKIDDEHTKHAVFCLMYSFPHSGVNKLLHVFPNFLENIKK